MPDKNLKFLQTQIVQLIDKINTIDEYCKEKEYYNGKREEKIETIINQIGDFNLNQKHNLKNLLNEQETLEEKLEKRIKEHEQELGEIKKLIDKLPFKILKYIIGSIPLTGIIIEIIINLDKIL